MKPYHMRNASRILAEEQDEYGNLPIEDEIVNGVNIMKSMWKPNAHERQALNDGGFVLLGIVGTTHPPVQVLAITKDGKLAE